MSKCYGELGWRDVEQGVLIPYNGLLPEQEQRDGVTYRIRRRYKGSPKYTKDNRGINIPYGLNLLSRYAKEYPLYITEGETDMVTLFQAGLQAVGIPGATIYKKEFNNYFKDFTTIIVVIDSDEPGRKMLRTIVGSMPPEERVRVFFVEVPDGIKDINEWHCHQCYKNIEIFADKFKMLPVIPATEEGFEMLVRAGVDVVNETYIQGYARVCLGNTRMELEKFAKRMYALQGKDMGVSASTIKKCASDALAMVLTQTQEANEALVAISQGTVIIEEDGCYKLRKLAASGFVYEPFTNFTAIIKHVYVNEVDEETARWELHGPNGVHTIMVSSKEKVSAAAFLDQVCKQAGFMYRVPAVSGFHQMFMQYIEDTNVAPRVKYVRRMGKYEDKWLFPTFGIDSKGDIVPLDTESNSYLLDGVAFAPPIDNDDDGIRYPTKVDLPMPEQLPEKAIADLLYLLDVNQGSKLGWGLLGWMGATYFKDLVISMDWGFPVAYITGNAQSGKTTLATWILKTVGMLSKTAGGATSTAYGINKISSWYGNLPLWFDDIRDLQEGGIWNKVILGAYENAVDYKGTINGGVAIPNKYNSTLLITSEFFVRSPAAMTRCCRFTADDTEQDRSVYNKLNLLINSILPVLGTQMAVRSQRKKLTIKELLKKFKEKLVEEGIRERLAQNYAVVYAGFRMLFWDYLMEDSEIVQQFTNYIIEHAKSELLKNNSSSYAEELLADFAGILVNPTYSQQFRKDEQWFVRDDKWFIFTTDLYETWRRYKGMNGSNNLINKQEFIAQLRRLTVAIRNSNSTAKFKGRTRTCLMFDLNKMRVHPNLDISTLPDLLTDDGLDEII